MQDGAALFNFSDAYKDTRYSRYFGWLYARWGRFVQFFGCLQGYSVQSFLCSIRSHFPLYHSNSRRRESHLRNLIPVNVSVGIFSLLFSILLVGHTKRFLLKLEIRDGSLVELHIHSIILDDEIDSFLVWFLRKI